MRKQLVIVRGDTPEEFQDAFNSKLRELEYCDPTYEFNHGAGYCAYIMYSDNQQFVGIVDPKKRCICDSCLRCLEPPRPRVKWRKCAIYGGVVRTDKCDDYLEAMS